ncbi:MAG: hypothetical protein MUE40_04130 [Anaerolineae bacterium]|nr:hypothetical protein [Anaerolineae bacterium]
MLISAGPRSPAAALALLCTLLLATLYVALHSARIESGDALKLFDSASSLARFGDLRRDESLWFTPPVLLYPEWRYPLSDHEAGTEASIALVALFYRLVDALPGVGYVQAVWLSGAVLVALSAWVFFWLVKTVGYADRVAVLATLVYGTATLVLPYARTLFREAQVLPVLLLSLLALLRWRQAGLWRGRWWALPAAAALFMAYLFKESSLMAVPGLLMLALPDASRWLPAGAARWLRRLNWLALALLLAGLVASVYSEAFFNVLLHLLEPLLSRTGLKVDFFRPALHTYLFSAGGSLWATSPVLLLALPGALRLLRDGQTRLVWLVVLVIGGFAGGHALLTGVHWFGGVSWPPRFLVPVVPLAMLLTLPALAALWQPGRGRWLWRGLFGGLFAYSLWVNFSAISIPWRNYMDLLPAGVPFEWADGLNRLEYLRPFSVWRAWGNLGIDIAWLRAGIPGWLLLYLLLAAGLLLLMGHILRAGVLRRGHRRALWAAPLLLAGLTWGGLRALYTADTLYAQKPQLHQVMQVLAAEAQPGEVLLLTDNVYSNFVLNHNRLPLRVITLPYVPGERPGPDTPPAVVSANPADLLMGHNGVYIVPALIDYLAAYHDRLWVLTDKGPFITWAVRPVERYLGQHYYLLRVVETDDPAVRLLEYRLLRTPDAYSFINPEVLTDLRFGDDITLTGYTLPAGSTYRPGDVLPVSFTWQTAAPLPAEYVVAWFLAPQAGNAPPVQGRDTVPGNGFAGTRTWQPGLPVWDHHALRLPPALTPGTYRLWVVLYQFSPEGTPQRLPVTGAETLEGTAGVLPGTLTVLPAAGPAG